jgi:hypothetical protein
MFFLACGFGRYGDYSRRYSRFSDSATFGPAVFGSIVDHAVYLSKAGQSKAGQPFAVEFSGGFGGVDGFGQPADLRIPRTKRG